MRIFVFAQIILAINFSNILAQHSEIIPPIISPNQIMERLLKGNERFVEEIAVHPHQDIETRTKTANEGQKPLVSILSCSDSRVPLEEIFDVGVGDIFAVRVAGNVANQSEIGSLEYGVEHLGTPLLIVIGHTKCGAVTAVVKNSELHGNILSLTKNIEPAVKSVREQYKNITDDDLIMKSIKANIWQSIEDILKSSSIIRTLVKSGKLKVIGALYDIETGKVTNLGVHFRQEQIMMASEHK